MKLLLLTLLLISCCKPKERVCKTVAEVGGCTRRYCGVKFKDGTFTSKARNPIVGATMCTKGSFYHIQGD
jgi:hypothetical protein